MFHNFEREVVLKYSAFWLVACLTHKVQPVITTRIYVLQKITIALKFMSDINSDLPIPAKNLQTPG